MRWISLGVGIIMLLLGGIWLLQGINVLPGSFMSGQAFWAVMGLLLIAGGIIACIFGLRRGTSTPSE